MLIWFWWLIALVLLVLLLLVLVGAFLLAHLKRKRDFLTKWQRDTFLDLRSRSGVTALASANCCLSSWFSLFYLFLSKNSVFTLKTDKGKLLNIPSRLIPFKKKKRTDGSAQEEVCKTCAEFRPMIKQKTNEVLWGRIWMAKSIFLLGKSSDRIQTVR